MTEAELQLAESTINCIFRMNPRWVNPATVDTAVASTNVLETKSPAACRRKFMHTT